MTYILDKKMEERLKTSSKNIIKKTHKTAVQYIVQPLRDPVYAENNDDMLVQLQDRIAETLRRADDE